jgi:hypothetical protein
VPGPRCVVLVPVVTHVEPECERGLRELERRGVTVRELRGFASIEAAKSQMATDALADGFDELVWVGPAVVFHPNDLDALRRHGRPFVCGLYPRTDRRELACTFPPGTARVTLGKGGGLVPVASCGLGFAYTRREVYDAVRGHHRLPELTRGAGRPVVPYFAPFWREGDGDPGPYLANDEAFCERARQAGVEILADTTVRLWQVGRYRFGWEDCGPEPERYQSVHLALAGGGVPHEPPPPAPPAASGPRPPIDPGPLRQPAVPLPAGFPRVRLYVVSYPANAESLRQTLASVRASDWGDEPEVVMQPADWPVGREAGARTYRMALERAAADGCDFAVILEDDVRVGAHVRHNLLTNQLVARDVADYLGLFLPDLVADPWERTEAHLGYRLARPRYTGPDDGWEKHRLWGAQGYCLSARLVRAALERWDRLTGSPDSRVLGVCGELGLPPWYTAPCLVEHAPLRSAFGTPAARAVDFDPDFRLELGPGFQPPDGVPGHLTIDEGRALFNAAVGRDAIELGTDGARATVCLAQGAKRVVTMDIQDQGPAIEWARRFGVAERVEFRQGDVNEGLGGGERFGLAFVDTEHDAASVRRDLEVAVRVLEPGGLVAVHDYPDPGWPAVRAMVDEFAGRLGWKRIAQADYLGVFRTGGEGPRR